MNAFLSDKLRTWIVCASYAILNALDDDHLDILDIENSTGVPFGVASYGSDYDCARILTPSTIFWDGIDSVKKIMGICIEKRSFSERKELLYCLDHVPPSNMILGPLNMAYLTYLPLCAQYKFADHYIAIKKTLSGEYILIDSEGIPGMKVLERDLYNFLNISGIPEANGLFHMGIVRIIKNPISAQERAYEIFRIAEKNYLDAEKNGQGGAAFLKCREVMDTYPASHWISPLLYALSHLMQRKLMFLEVDKEHIILKTDFRKHIIRQIKIIIKLRSLLSERRFSNAFELLPAMAESETIISMKWKEWIAPL